VPSFGENLHRINHDPETTWTTTADRQRRSDMQALLIAGWVVTIVISLQGAILVLKKCGLMR
jgi:hypothetical protein